MYLFSIQNKKPKLNTNLLKVAVIFSKFRTFKLSIFFNVYLMFLQLFAAKYSWEIFSPARQTVSLAKRMFAWKFM